MKHFWYLALFTSSLFALNFPQGATKDVRSAQLKPAELKSKSYNEFWSYHFYFDQGSKLLFNFSRANVGSLKDPVCGTNLNFINFSGKNYSLAREYDKKSRFRWDGTKTQLNIHPDIYFKGAYPGTQKIKLDTKKKGVHYKVDLTIDSIENGKVPGNGIYGLGREKVGVLIHIPFAKVSGTITLNGKDHKVSGMVYMDHTYQSDTAPEIARRGFRYAALDGSEVGYFLLPRPKKHRGVPMGYSLKKENGIWVVKKPKSFRGISSTKKAGGKYLTEVQITFEDGSISTIRQKKLYDGSSMLKDFSGFTKWAIKKFLGGEIISYFGEGQLNSETKVLINQFDNRY
jgi:hypothetical protein